MRRQHGNGLMSGDFHAWAFFLEEMENYKNIGCILRTLILECSGVGRNNWYIKRYLQEYRDKGIEVFTVLLSADKTECYDRTLKRGDQKVPFPYKDMNVKDAISYMGDKKGEVEMDFYTCSDKLIKIDNTKLSPEQTMNEVIQMIEEDEE